MPWIGAGRLIARAQRSKPSRSAGGIRAWMAPSSWLDKVNNSSRINTHFDKYHSRWQKWFSASFKVNGWTIRPVYCSRRVTYQLVASTVRLPLFFSITTEYYSRLNKKKTNYHLLPSKFGQSSIQERHVLLDVFTADFYSQMNSCLSVQQDNVEST